MLFIETCQRCSRALPCNLYDIDNPSGVINALRYIAKDILDNYAVARPYIKDQDVLEDFDIIRESCKIVYELLNYKRDKDDFPGIYQGMEFFSHLDMKPWYRILKDCFEDTNYSTFSHALNLSEQYTLVHEDGEFEQIDACSEKLTPTLNQGMVLYAFSVLLMTKRNIFTPRANDWEEITSSPIEKYWATQFSQRINWKTNYYYITEDSWKEAYLRDNPTPKSSDISINNRLLLHNFLGREVFEDLLSPESFEDYLKGYSPEVNYDQYLYIRNKDKDCLANLRELLQVELDYLYNNISSYVSCFYEKEQAELDIQESVKRNSDSKNRNNQFIDEQFANIEKLDVDDVHRIFFNNALYLDIYSWNQPMIFSEIVRGYLINCIVQEEKLTLILSQKINDLLAIRSNHNEAPIAEKSTRETPVNADSNSFVIDMKEYLEADGKTIKGKKAVFVRAMVRKGHVPPADENWKEVFSTGQRWKEILAPDSEIEINVNIGDELSDLTRRMRWEDFNGKFIFKGRKQTSHDLQKAFSDGDPRFKERGLALRGLYKKIMS